MKSGGKPTFNIFIVENNTTYLGITSEDLLNKTVDEHYVQVFRDLFWFDPIFAILHGGFETIPGKRK